MVWVVFGCIFGGRLAAGCHFLTNLGLVWRHLGAHWPPLGRHVPPGGALLGSPAAFLSGFCAFGKETQRFHPFQGVPGSKKASFLEGDMWIIHSK